jgi:hypothetical protein
MLKVRKNLESNIRDLLEETIYAGLKAIKQDI